MRCYFVRACCIAGLEEAVSQLSVGDVAKVVIPASLAYGKRGLPGLYVAPFCALVVLVALLAAVHCLLRSSFVKGVPVAVPTPAPLFVFHPYLHHSIPGGCALTFEIEMIAVR